MPTLLKFTTFVSSTFHPKPHRSLLRRCTAVSIPSPATIPCRNFTPSVSRTIKSAFLGLRSSSQFVFNKGGRKGGGGGFRAPFTRGGGGKSSGFYTDMGSESNNRDDQWLDNNDYSIASTLQQPNHNDDGLKNPVESPSKQPRHQTTKLLTLPTILTIGRVAAVPILVCTFYVNAWWGTTATTSIFIAAAITDWLDGYLARKMKLGSAFGAFLDPVADKLMVAATLVLLCTRPPEVTLFEQFPWLLTVPSIAIIGREITMSAVREWAASQGGNLSEAVAVNNLGKWKTATQMISLTILLLTRSSSLADSGVLVASGVSLLYISAWLAVWSLVVYMKKIWKVLLK